MSAKSVIILNSVAAKNSDAFVKSGKIASAMENGNVVVPGAKSTTSGESDVYVVTKPATSGLTTDTFYMVYEAPVPVINGKYKGITDDPREFEIASGVTFNMQKPQVGDEITITAAGLGGSKSSNGYIEPVDGDAKLNWAASVTASLGYVYEGDTFISIGSERVVAYKFRCVKAS